MIYAPYIPDVPLEFSEGIRAPITPEIRDRLHQAIDSARLRGKCQYVEGDSPCCVIGQFGFLSGISLEVLKSGTEQEQESNRMYKVCDSVLNRTAVGGRSVFSNLGAPTQLLRRIQNQWDVNGDELEGKEQMKEILNEWPCKENE